MIAYHSVHMLQSRCTLLRGPLQQAAYLLYRAITPSSPRESLTKADIFQAGLQGQDAVNVGLRDDQNMLLCSRPDVIEGYVLIILSPDTSALSVEDSILSP